MKRNKVWSEALAVEGKTVESNATIWGHTGGKVALRLVGYLCFKVTFTLTNLWYVSDTTDYSTIVWREYWSDSKPTFEIASGFQATTTYFKRRQMNELEKWEI